MVDDPWWRCLLLIKTVALEARNMLAHCSEKSTSDLSLLAAHGINKPFQQLHTECLINSSLFGYIFKVDDTPDVKKQIDIILFLDFDIHGLFDLWEVFDLHSMDCGLASGSY
jgi:hypothetical protein